MPMPGRRSRAYKEETLSCPTVVRLAPWTSAGWRVRLHSGIGGKVNLRFSVLSHKLVEEASGENAGPSTTFVAKNAPNFAQDDSVFCLASFRLRTLAKVEASMHAGNHAEGPLNPGLV